ncbi:MAG: 30S ribosomal protein S1 [candidate division WOR-3 bacterium]
MSDINQTNNLKSQKGDEYLDLYSYTFRELNPGDIVKGRIVRCLANGVIVDIGLKSEAFLPLDEFSPGEEIVEGQEISVLVEEVENKEGIPVISKRKAETKIAWKIFEEKFANKESIQAKVINKVKGGLTVEIHGFPAFLPGSQVDLKPVINFDELIGKTLEVRILNLNPQKRNIVVSRRVILEERLLEARKRVFSQVKPGDIVEATVTGIADFGVFVEIDGVPALLHISDLSWDKVVHPRELVQIGQQLKVKVLTVDYENYRITVGLKQLTPHPWEAVEAKYPIGSKVTGKVTSIVDYGAFVELEPNIEGLIHISEMSWDRSVHHPSQILKVGDIVSAVVLNIDRDNRKISLGLKQTLPDPWSMIDEKFQIGQKVEGRVVGLKNFGAFVEIEPGIVGLVRNQDLSWTKKVRHPREVLKRNQKIEAIILDIDRELRQLTLGYKQIQEDPFYTFSTEYKVGDKIKARIVDINSAGLIVSLPHQLEGFVPKSQLVRSLDEKNKKKDQEVQEEPPYQIGSEIELQITFIDYDNRKIGLSEKAVYASELKKERKKETVEEFEPEETKPRFTLEDHLGGVSILDTEPKKKKKNKK